MNKRFSVAALLVTLFTVVFSATSNAASFSDIENSKYRNAVITLSNLKVIDGYEDGTFRPDATITRAEFTKMLVCTMGFGDSVQYGSPAFTDIDMWAKNYISTAFGLGIVNGMDDYTFAPDDPVTYEQAQKMMVCALGYDENALAKGGWPNGYISMAGELRLKNDITGTANSAPAPRGVIAQLMYNSLEVEMKEFKNAQWYLTDKTLLKDYLNVVRLKGTLVGVEDYVTNECKKNLGNYEMDVMSASGEEVLISFRDFTKNVTDINKFIGNIITVYYNHDSVTDDKKLIAIDSETVKNSEVSVKYSDIESFDGSSLSYDADGRSRSARINMNTVSVRYNGKPVRSDENIRINGKNYTLREAVNEWLSPESDNFIYGDVKLTDKGSDGVIDLIQIYNYDTMVAYQAPKTTDYRITDKLISGNHLTLDPNSSDYSYTIQKNGAQIEVTSIAAGDIVLCAKSLDDTLYTVYVMSNPVSGTVTTIEDDFVYINKTKYQKGKMCDEYIDKNQSGKVIKVGVSGTFYVDMYNTIVYATVNNVTENLPYAYIASAVFDRSEGTGYITLYTSGTQAKIYEMKNKVKFNGKSMNADDVISRLNETGKYSNSDASDEWSDIIYNGDKPKVTSCSQIARVNITSNQIASIVTLDANTSGVANESSESIVRYTDLTQCIFTSNSTAVTKKGSFKLSDSTSSTAFSTDDSTTVIYVPKDRTDKDAYASKGFRNDDTYFVEAYDLKSTKVASLVLVYSNKDNTLTEVTQDTNFGIVSSPAVDSYDSATDETTKKFKVFYGPNNSSQTTEKQWQAYLGPEFSDMSVGDVVQFAYDTSNHARARIDNIRFSDIAEVLDGDVKNNNRLYDWSEEQTPSKENNYQSMKFDYRFKYFDVSSKEYLDKMYNSNAMSYIYSRACMYNVLQVFEDDKKLYVTKDGFDADGTISDENYEEIQIDSSTKILRMADNRKSLSRYAPDTTTDLSIVDFKASQYYGDECSKILVCSSKGAAKLIVIYN